MFEQATCVIILIPRAQFLEYASRNGQAKRIGLSLTPYITSKCSSVSLLLTFLQLIRTKTHLLGFEPRYRNEENCADIQMATENVLICTECMFWLVKNILMKRLKQLN